MPRYARLFADDQSLRRFALQAARLFDELELEEVANGYTHRNNVVEGRAGYRMHRNDATECLECSSPVCMHGNDGSMALRTGRPDPDSGLSRLRDDTANFCSTVCAEEHGARRFSRQWIIPDYCYGQLLSYSESNNKRSRATTRNPWLIGVEVEKTDYEFQPRALGEALRHDWIAVSDGSLPSDSGFELVSPAYNLTSDTDKSKLDSLCESWPILDSDANGDCGGHINLSRRGTTGPELAALFGDFVPLIYSLYPRRLRGTWCQPRKANQHTDRDEKYRAFNVRSDRVEIRIFSRVKTGAQLLWRINLLRLFAKHGFENIAELIEQDESWLVKHLAVAYDGELDRIETVRERFRAFRLWHLNRYDYSDCPELRCISDYVRF